MTTIIPFSKLSIKHDFMFKKVIRSKRICKHLLEEVLQTKIADISYPETEKTIEPAYDSRGIRLDVTVDDDKNTHYNLEMQVKNIKNPDTGIYVLPKRTRYYQAMIDIESLQKGQDYDLLPPTFIIFICVFDFFNEGNYIYTFKKRCLENLHLELPDETTTIFLNTVGNHGNITNDLKSFFEYVNKEVITSDFTKQIDEEVTDIKHNKKVRKEYMLYEAMKMDIKREARAEGELNANLNSIKTIMQKKGWSAEQAMELLDIPTTDYDWYLDKLLAKA